MSKTYTPELTPDVLRRLEDYAARFRDDFRLDRPARWAPVYLAGLIQEGERKSIEPLSRRVTLPPELPVKDPDQALQQFVNQSPWDEQQVWQRYRAVMAETFADPAGIFVIDDTSFPKQGKHSVGVQRQYCGALGKKANCQVAPSVHYVSPTEDNQYQARKMKDHGLFSDVHTEVGQIIVTTVNPPRIAELLQPDRQALGRLIRKEG